MQPKHKFIEQMSTEFFIISSKPTVNDQILYVLDISPVTKQDVSESDVQLPDDLDLEAVHEDEWLGISVEVGEGDPYFFASLEECAYTLDSVLKTYESEPDFKAQLSHLESPFYVERVTPTVTTSPVAESELLIANLSNDILSDTVINGEDDYDDDYDY